MQRCGTRSCPAAALAPARRGAPRACLGERPEARPDSELAWRHWRHPHGQRPLAAQIPLVRSALLDHYRDRRCPTSAPC